MEDKLKMIFTNTNDWLKFAEAKNGVLITLNGAAIVGLLTTIGNLPISLQPYKFFLILCLFSLMLSLVIALLSFIPKLKLEYLYSINISNTDNLIYYGHICKYSTERYLKAMYKSFNNIELNYANCSNYEKQLAEQIIVNSKIAIKKYYLFDLSIAVLIAAIVVTSIGSFIIA